MSLDVKSGSDGNECNSLSSYLSSKLSVFSDGNVDLETKLESADLLDPFIDNDDAYISFSGESNQAHLPALTSWNGNSGLRKGYTLLMWIRPKLESTFEQNKDAGDGTQSNDVDEVQAQRIIYRFSTSTEDSSGTGICVVCSQWKAVPLNDEKITQVVGGRNSSDVPVDTPPRYQLETMLTAYTLPHYKPHQVPPSGAAYKSSYCQQPLILDADKWQLLGFSHTNPYLKPAVWSVTVNGRLMGSDNLPYPVLPENHHVNSMEYCSLLQNISRSGAIVSGSVNENDKPDFEKTASQLQAESSKRHQIAALIFDLAAVALYAEKSIPLACLAVAADAGPALALQKGGRILPTLPPVANWTKGASLEGPKVGIPLAVHSSALSLQQLSSAPNLIFCCSALTAKVLGSPAIQSTRLVCHMQIHPGSTSNTPRVGLIQPSQTLRIAEEDLPCLYIVGNVRLYNAVATFLLHTSDDAGEELFSSIHSMTKNLSVALIEQDLLSALIQPFFLSLCPPGKIYDCQTPLYNRSLKILYDLYSDNGKLASKLILLFSKAIRSGGGRVHEEVLQSGLLHVLASSLRLSLLRASRLKLFSISKMSSSNDFVLKVQTLHPDESVIAPPQHGTGTSPAFIPWSIICACCDLVDACCGPPQTYLENLSPHQQIRRTSDLALTAIFGLAFDMDLWGGYPTAAAQVFEYVAKRYGGTCLTSGFIMRSQVSIQHFLDMARLRLDDTIYSVESPAESALERASLSLSKVLQAMLLSSLSNMRSISQGENDVAACVVSLCDCPLGTVGAHIILNAFMGVLVWCDVFNGESTSYAMYTESVNETEKLQVASRFGRNVLMAQFHDVIAPMLLSRMVFSGERVIPSSKNIGIVDQRTDALESSGDISWQNHWRFSLLLFSWVASQSGPEGILSSKSCGKLLLASCHAGSLDGALEKCDKEFISSLFFPSLNGSISVDHNFKAEWSYTDLLATRLEIVLPLLPGLIVSLLSRLQLSPEELASSNARILFNEIMTALGGALHRVYGRLSLVSDMPPDTPQSKNQNSKRLGTVSLAIKAAKSLSPHLVMIAALLEVNIERGSSIETSDDDIKLLQCQSSEDSRSVPSDLDSFINFVSLDRSKPGNEVCATVACKKNVRSTHLSYFTQLSQNIVVNSAAELVSNAMVVGGAGASIPLWDSLLSTLQQSFELRFYEKLKGKVSEYSTEQANQVRDTSDPVIIDSSDGDVTDSGVVSIALKANTRSDVAQCVLCRLVSSVLSKILRRTHPRELWGFELSSAVAELCRMVDKTMILKPKQFETSTTLKNEQIVLLFVLLDLLVHGRESAGWYQVIPLDVSVSGDTRQIGDAKNSMTTSSKLLLPMLETSLRIALQALPLLSSSNEGIISHADEEKKLSLLPVLFTELNHSLMAAIAGLGFSGARDTALHAMVRLREAVETYQTKRDTAASDLCNSMLVKVAEEIRIRYQRERKQRQIAIVDAYDGTDYDSKNPNTTGITHAIESIILGDDIGAFSLGVGNSEISDDFILFPEPNLSNGKLGFGSLEGLGFALEEFSSSTAAQEDSSKVIELITLLRSFLDAWESADTETVKETHGLSLQFLTNSDFEIQAPSGSDTAADTMSTFFEFAASEKNRLKEISSRFLPSYRYSRMAFSDRFCWSRLMESGVEIQDFWERGIGDGNRDIRSRIPTLPCYPQFRRFLPKYLDHSSAQELVPDSHDISNLHVNSPIAPEEFGALTKSLRETGHLEILDITKQCIEEEEEPEVPISSKIRAMDDDETALFPDSGLTVEHQDIEDVTKQSNPNIVNEDELQDDPLKVDETKVEDVELAVLPTDLLGKGQHNITTSCFSTPPDNASSSLSLLNSAAAGLIEKHVENCVHVMAEGNRLCTMLLTSSHLILEYDGNPDGFFEGEILARKEEADRQRLIEETSGSLVLKGSDDLYQHKNDRRQREVASLRPKSIRWNLTEVSHIYLRRYRLRDTALELFFIPTGATSFGGHGIFSPSSSLYLDFGPGYEGIDRRDDAAFAIMRRSPSQAIKQWPDRSEQFLHEQLNRLAVGWVEGRISNFDYLLHLNMLSGRSYNDICQYPVFPWVLSDYTSTEVPDLTDKNSYRDLSKPVGALNANRLNDFIERFNTFADPSIPPFMYGSHYSTSAGVVLHFLVRLHPFAGLHRQLQGGHFDVADRLFSSVPRTWSMCTGTSAAEVKELTPEWYCNPSFLRNVNKFKLGTSQDGEIIDDVVLPPWANGSPEKFVEVMRAALESDICSKMLSSWIDLIFGKKQQGPAAIEANNVFFYLTYYGTVDVASIEDESLRQATELQIAHFGQCPMQLFKRLHVQRLPKQYHNMSLYQILSSDPLQDIQAKPNRSMSPAIFGEPRFLPFLSAPLSHWVHLDAPPPGPHAAMIAVRFAGLDRCLAVDAKGVFHTFRWAWRAEEFTSESFSSNPSYFDPGCFIAQRELPRFRSVPRLPYTPIDDNAVVAISKTLFAGRSVLLVLSDGDGCGSFGMQLVDPAKGEIKGEVLVPQVHSARITCITTDPIGTAAGHGGVGGELCLVGSEDGTASLWRFMSSHYLPLRPRLKLRGHMGRKICGVALCSSLHLAATISSQKCCLYSIGNGLLLRSFRPPENTLGMHNSDDLQLSTTFANSSALAISVQGFVVTVSQTTMKSGLNYDRTVITLNLFTVEGIHISSKPLESWRGIPHRMECTPDGTTVMVCCGRGITMHRISVCQPLEFLDEFQITEVDEFDDGNPMPSAWDIDLGPTLNRPVVAASACSNGVVRLHALPGISSWSERHRSIGLTQSVGNVISRPAKRLNKVVRDGIGYGKQLAGMGRDLSQEVSSGVKQKGASVLFGSMFRRNNSNSD